MEAKKNNESFVMNELKGAITEHKHVACDGCGMSPLIGIRYKCSVCENFDYCEICEERLNHAHPFLKITSPD